MVRSEVKTATQDATAPESSSSQLEESVTQDALALEFVIPPSQETLPQKPVVSGVPPLAPFPAAVKDEVD